MAPAGGGPQQTSRPHDKKILYWHDPMAPGQKFDKPGKSPFMDMQLVPVYADGDGDEGYGHDQPARAAEPGRAHGRGDARARWQQLVEAVGTVAFNERDQAVVQARSNGFVEKLLRARAARPRAQGPAAGRSLYVPEWVAAQEEYLSVRRMTGTRLEALVDGARQRMRLAGMTEEQIRLVETTGKVHSRLTVTAPISGVVAELGAREGMTVMAGATLFRINGLDTVWVNAEVPREPGSAGAARAIRSRRARPRCPAPRSRVA